VAVAAGFLLLFPVPAVRSFYALALPHRGIWGMLLIAALGAAALTGFWVLSCRLGRGPAEAAPNELNRPASPWPRLAQLA
jgi:hypothetical protein